MGAKFGEKNINSKLTDKEVKKIWKLIQKGIPYTIIAEKYAITASALGRIGRGETWTSITKLENKVYRKGGPK